MLIGQISDLHIKADGKLSYRVVDTAGMLARCVEHVAAPIEPAVSKAAPVPAEPTQAADKPREIIGYRDVRVPGRPLSECMGPDREIGPEVLRCRDGYLKREPIYR